MKHSILGFYQEEVLKCKTTIDVNGKEKEICIDVTDLLILQCVADFMNRQHIYKYMINDKLYFSIQYKALLEDLPILNISKQALRDRIDKLVLFNLLEKEVTRNEQGSFVVFRIGTRYEQFVYNKTGVPVCSEVEGGVYQTTQGCVSNYTPKNSSTINSSTIKEKEDNKLSSQKKKKEYDEFVERMYALYPTKCPIRGASLGKSYKDKERIQKLLRQYTEDEIESVFKNEIEEKYGKHYMQNLSTFLNNFPDPNVLLSDSDNKSSSDNKLIIGGRIYR